MALVHLFSGYIGFGKTTIAKQIELETGALRITPDDIIKEKFGTTVSDDFMTKAQQAEQFAWGGANSNRDTQWPRCDLRCRILDARNQKIRNGKSSKPGRTTGLASNSVRYIRRKTACHGPQQGQKRIGHR